MIKKFLDLGKQPLANRYITKNKLKKKETFYNLQIGFDNKTKLVSIINTVKSETMFDSKYPYRASMSKTMKESFTNLSKKIKKKIKPSTIMEIGSNDGSFIKNFKKNKTICVEPCKKPSLITKKLGYKTYNNFWTINLAKKIKSENRKIDLIYSANTLTHIKDLNSVFKAISLSISKDGILIIEDPWLLECLKKCSYDQFYNEHIYLFSIISLTNVLKNHNMEIFDLDILDVHGGSLRYYIKNVVNRKFNISKKVKNLKKQELKFGLDRYSTFKKFGNKVKKSKKSLIKIIKNLKKKNYKIIGYGSTAKATTILNYCKINNKMIDYFFDTTPDKVNKYMPGSKIYIKKYSKALTSEASYVFLGAWNFKKEIFKKERKFIKNGGKFITHIPKPRII